MLIEDVHQLFQLIVGEFYGFKLNILFDRAVSLCNQKNSIKEDDFKKMARSIIDDCSSVSIKTKFEYMPERIKELLMSHHFKIALASEIVAFISGSVSENKSYCASSGEISSQKADVESVINRLHMCTLVYDEFFLEKEYKNLNSIVIDIAIPRRSFDNSYTKFVAISREVDLLFRQIQEFVGEDAGDVEVVKLGTSEPIVTIAVTAVAARVFISIYKQILDAMQKTVDFIRSYKEMMAYSEVLERVSAPDMIEKYVQKNIDAVLDGLVLDSTSGSNDEKKNKIKARIPKVAKMISSGVRVSIDKNKSKLDGGQNQSVGSLSKDLITISDDVRRLSALLDAKGPLDGLLEFHPDSPENE